MNRTFKIVMMILVILLNISVLPHFSVFHIVPNYTFVFLMIIALLFPDSESVVIAGFSGLLTDLLSGSLFGLNTLLCIYLTIACIFISGAFFIKKMKLICPLCFVLSFVYELLFGAASVLSRGAAFLPQMMLTKALPTAVFNTVLFAVLYPLLKRVKIEKRKRGIKYER